MTTAQIEEAVVERYEPGEEGEGPRVLMLVQDEDRIALTEEGAAQLVRRLLEELAR